MSQRTICRKSIFRNFLAKRCWKWKVFVFSFTYLRYICEGRGGRVWPCFGIQGQGCRRQVEGTRYLQEGVWDRSQGAVDPLQGRRGRQRSLPRVCSPQNSGISLFRIPLLRLKIQFLYPVFHQVCNSASPNEVDFDDICNTLLGTSVNCPVIISCQVSK